MTATMSLSKPGIWNLEVPMGFDLEKLEIYLQDSHATEIMAVAKHFAAMDYMTLREKIGPGGTIYLVECGLLEMWGPP